MDEIPYEQGAYYVFDLKRLYHINEIEAYFEKITGSVLVIIY